MGATNNCVVGVGVGVGVGVEGAVVITIPSGAVPTGMAAPGVLVATVIGLMLCSYATLSWAPGSVAEPGSGMVACQGGWGNRRRCIAGSPGSGMRIRPG